MECMHAVERPRPGVHVGNFLAVLLFGFTLRPRGYLLGLGLLVAGFVWHTVGVGTRWAIAGRAPVSDMYESLVFTGWGAIAVAMVPEALYRRRFFALVAGLLGFLILAFAENLPIDSAINPLVPVLAHTSWLSIHVMTIMLSYSALALTMALGHVALFLQLFRPGRTEQLQLLLKPLYKTLQVGLLFLAAGIICGAVWANESWGATGAGTRRRPGRSLPSSSISRSCTRTSPAGCATSAWRQARFWASCR